MRFRILLGCRRLATPVALADAASLPASPMEMTLAGSPEQIQLEWSAPADDAMIGECRIQRFDGGPFVAIHNWPGCRSLGSDPGPLGMPVELASDCSMPPPASLPRPPVSAEGTLQTNPLAIRDPAC